MRPSVSLGSGANVDDLALGIRDLYRSLTKLSPPDDPVLRERVTLLLGQAGAASATLDELSTSTTATLAGKRASAQEARSVVLTLVDLGAIACAPLAPAQ